MLPFPKRRGQVQYLWKVYLLFFSLLTFILGYICGTAMFYLSGDSLQISNLNPVSVHATAYRKSTCFLTIGILSGSNNGGRRQTIRNTWLNLKPTSNILHAFVIGTEGLSAVELSNLQNEQKMYNDLALLDNVKDSYQHLSRKMLKYFIWLDKSINFTFVLKCDDDSFVHLENMYRELTNMQRRSKFYWGFFDGRAHVKKVGRWSEKNWILCDRYLPYAQGGGYVLSHDIVKYVARNSDNLEVFSNEDVSVGVWTAPLMIERVHDPRFDTEYESRGCFNTYLVTHKQSIDQMKRKYENLRSTGVMCSQEFRNKKSYVYNWFVPPSMCCVRNNSHVP